MFNRNKLSCQIVKHESKLFFLSLFFLLVQVSMAITMIDDDGNKITFNKPYNRIISLYGAHTEVLKGIGAKESMIGVESSNKELDIEKFSYKDNIEKFISAKPDLVLIRPMISHRYKGLVRSLKNAGIEVISIKPNHFDELEKYWTKLGQISGHEEEARGYIEAFNKEIKMIKLKTSKIPKEELKSVFFEARHKGGIKTSSPGGIPSYILNILNIKNIASDVKIERKGSTVSSFPKELLLSRGNQIDYYISQKGAMNKTNLEIIRNTPGFKAIKAVREDNIYIIEEDLVSRPTKELIKGVNKIGAMVYPKYFNGGKK